MTLTDVERMEAIERRLKNTLDRFESLYSEFTEFYENHKKFIEDMKRRQNGE